MPCSSNGLGNLPFKQGDTSSNLVHGTNLNVEESGLPHLPWTQGHVGSNPTV